MTRWYVEPALALTALVAAALSGCAAGSVGQRCSPTQELCGDGIDQDCDGTDLACPACAPGAVASRCACGGAVSTEGHCCAGVHQADPCAGAGAPDLPPWIVALPDLANGMKWMPGVPGGIPDGVLDTTLTSAQMNTRDINAAISAASARGSPSSLRVVAMPAGTFSIAGTIQPRSHVILRGAGAWGAGRTRLVLDAGASVESPFDDWGAAPLTEMALPPGGSLPVGSTTVPVASSIDLAVGDLVQLDELDDLSYVWLYDAGYSKRAPFPDGPYSGPFSLEGFRSVASLHVVTAVHAAGVEIDPPTRIAFTYFSQADGSTRLRPQVWRVSRRDDGGLWHFGLERVSITGTSAGGVIFHAGAHCWIADVETDTVSGDHVRFDHQFRSEIRRVYAHDTVYGPYSGGGNYGLNLDAATSECLVIDSIVRSMNKLIQTNACGPGNVIAYNYADNTSANGGDWMDGAINGSHQSFSHHLLVEGNLSANIGCDTTHGNSGFMAFVRNRALGRSTDYQNTGNLRAANSDAFQREMAFTGNVLEAPGAQAVYEATGPMYGDAAAVWSIGQAGDGGSGDAYDDQVTRPWRNVMSYGGTVYDGRQATFTTKARDLLWRHGNWDSVHGAVHDWQPSYPGHVVPTSLFLTQAPAFFGARVWPWIDPTGATAAERVRALPAKDRFDAGTPFAP